ncbi:sporulation integral membrane protein YtvI [Halalkalibacter urbisdiaboli]|uniref:sporulation integral membrane protein YtvI n=1 Tax=Halalkalibacter urbisdiaboli TaxID=1960589 RepID=UPI001FD9D94F|nr:sporulation integral membrane protein YtvI [Halalkalibacter urbisdiaboli]
MSNNKILQMIFRVLIVAVLVAIGLYVFFNVVTLTFPFIIAAVFAFMINPLVTFLEKICKLPRTLAVLSAILFLFGLVGGVLTLIIFKLVDGFQYLSRLVPTHIEQISINIQAYVNEHLLPLWIKGIGMIDHLEDSQRSAIENSIQQLGVQFASILGNVGQAIANSLSHFVGALPITLTVFIFIILSLYFISKDWNHYRLSLKKKLPVTVTERFVQVYVDLKSKVIGFITAQCILISMTAILNFIGLLVLKVEHPLTIALVLGVVDLLPYLGTGIILIPWAVYSLVMGDLFLGVGLLILYGLTIILRQFAEPKVLSSSLGLNPLATLISLFVGLQLFGFIGLVIGPVILVIVVSMHQANVFEGIWRFIKNEPE